MEICDLMKLNLPAVCDFSITDACGIANEEAPKLRRLARRRKRTAAAFSLAGWSSNEATEA